MADDSHDSDEPSKRDLARTGAVAAGTAGLGLAAAGSAAAQQQEGRALVFAYDYHPGLPFTVTAPLQTSLTVDILDGPDDEGVPEISQPDDWNGFVVHYAFGQDGGMFAYVFSQQDLSRDQEYTLGGDAQVFSTQLNLLEANMSQGAGDGPPAETPTEPGAESPTPEGGDQPGGDQPGAGNGGGDQPGGG